MTRQKLIDLGWKVSSHLFYSPDMARSDYHLFCSLKHSLDEKKFDDRVAIKKTICHVFESQLSSFYKDGIHSLKEKWQKVVESRGRY